MYKLDDILLRIYFISAITLAELTQVHTLSITNFKFEVQGESLKPDANTLPSSCYEATRSTHKSGIYEILVPSYSTDTFYVPCDENIYYGGWTIIQRRMDGAIDFYRNWTEYKNGFGDLRADFWMGLDKLYAMTTASEVPQELLIMLKTEKNETKFVKYSSFAIGSEAEDYALNVLGDMFGNAFNAFGKHLGYKFSTQDRDNDGDNKEHFAQKYKTAWWAKNHGSLCDLNAPFGGDDPSFWSTGTSLESIKFSQMMIRPQYQYRDRKNM